MKEVICLGMIKFLVDQAETRFRLIYPAAGSLLTLALLTSGLLTSALLSTQGI